MYIFIRKIKDDKEFDVQNLDMPIFIRKIIIIVNKLFKKTIIKKIDKLHYLYLIYCPKSKKNNCFYIERKIRNIIKDNPKAKIILSKELQEYGNRLDIKKENKIIKYFLIDLLKYIVNIRDEELESKNVAILADEYNMINCNIIKTISEKVKTLTVVTNNIKNYRKLEEILYEENAMLITITNNKKKALKKIDFIINLDFDIKQIEEYYIRRDAIIVNCSCNSLNIAYFQGIIINDVELKITDDRKEKYKLLLRGF